MSDHHVVMLHEGEAQPQASASAAPASPSSGIPAQPPASTSAIAAAAHAASSAASHAAHEAQQELQQGLKSAKQRWKQLGQAVRGAGSLMRAGTAAISHLPGTVQGIDLRRKTEDYAWLDAKFKTGVNITCCDYNSTSVSFENNITNESLPSFLMRPRPAWSRVRWINVEGVSWDVITALALKFELHPLAVEDVVHFPQRIKADFYEQFIYLSLTMTMVDRSATDQQQQRTGASSDVLSCLPAGPLLERVPSDQSLGGLAGTARASTSGAGSGGMKIPTKAELAAAERGASRACEPVASSHCAPRNLFGCMADGTPGSGARHMTERSVQVSAEQVNVFLTSDNTIITIFQKDGSPVTRPILAQLKEQRTLLRDSEDGSLLVNQIIDAIVDMAYPIVEAFNELLDGYETKVLTGSPCASYTRELHVMQGDLNLLKRTIQPTYNLVQTLRAHAIDPGKFGSPGGSFSGLTEPERRGSPSHGPASMSPAAAAAAAVAAATPFLPTRVHISKNTKIYLGDVQDHLSTILDNITSLSEQCRDLIDLIFNLISHNTNRSMQTLTVVSVLFLPLTFLAGIYGMNFDNLPELHWPYGYTYFYCMCAMISVIFLFTMWRKGMLNGQ